MTNRFGRTPSGYLQGLGSQQLTYDIQRMLSADAGLRIAAHHYYVGEQRKHSDGFGGDFLEFDEFDF